MKDRNDRTDYVTKMTIAHTHTHILSLRLYIKHSSLAEFSTKFDVVRGTHKFLPAAPDFSPHRQRSHSTTTEQRSGMSFVSIEKTLIDAVSSSRRCFRRLRV